MVRQTGKPGVIGVFVSQCLQWHAYLPLRDQVSGERERLLKLILQALCCPPCRKEIPQVEGLDERLLRLLPCPDLDQVFVARCLRRLWRRGAWRGLSECALLGTRRPVPALLLEGGQSANVHRALDGHSHDGSGMQSSTWGQPFKAHGCLFI